MAGGPPAQLQFFILVAAEDEDKLALHTEAMLWEYLNEAPPGASGFEGPYWDKYHVGYVGSNGGATSQDVYVAQGRTMSTPHRQDVPTRPWALSAHTARSCRPIERRRTRGAPA